ncbi:Dehydroquinase [Chaetomium fimeti]|uniref:Catabolic 3-dehydroquinase n=1 Tax=Chaetomium fimeti TaxID=1854472 RepID=A0AAE0H8J7_9PEZI|nr:Dehydroquinase [Chaetomium fimeti]
MAPHILLINGPNLNLLGTREPHIYGHTTLTDVESQARAQATSLGATLSTFQSNHEGAIIDRIHAAAGHGPLNPTKKEEEEPKASMIIINPGALTHTSVGLRDALLGTGTPFVEVHVSNVHGREEFRRHSYLSDKAVAVVCGMGVFGYRAAVEFAVGYLRERGEGGKGGVEDV